MNMAKRPVEKYDFKAFGQAIKNARKERKESRKKVSDEMYIPRVTLQTLRTTAAPKFTDFLWAYAAYLYSVDQFL